MNEYLVTLTNINVNLDQIALPYRRVGLGSISYILSLVDFELV